MDDVDDAARAEPAPELLPPTDLIVDRWWEECFPRAAIAINTEAWKIAHAAKETLKRLLRSNA